MNDLILEKLPPAPPIVSILAFTRAWCQDHDIVAIRKFARETLFLVPLGLTFFVPQAMSLKAGLSFFPSLLVESYWQR